MVNKRSDVAAKEAFVKRLESRGFCAKIISSPVDIIAEKDGVKYYYEIKMTRKKDSYFGAATLTEWRQAFLSPEHFRFVVAIANESDSDFEFIEYTPSEFSEFSTVPPFKVYFNIVLNKKSPKVFKSKRKSIPFTKEIFAKLDECYNALNGRVQGVWSHGR